MAEQAPKSFKDAEKYFDSINKNEFTAQKPMMGGSGFSLLNSYMSLWSHILKEFKSNGTGIGAYATSGGKGLDFIASKTALSLLSPSSFGSGEFGLRTGKVFNPITTLFPTPVSTLTTAKLDVPTSLFNPASSIHVKEDLHKQLYEGTYRKVEPANILQGRNPLVVGKFYPEQNFQTQKMLSEEAQNNRQGVFFDTEDNSDFGNFISDEDSVGVPIQKPNYAAIFDKRRTGPGYDTAGKGADWYKTNFSAKKKKSLLYSRRENAMQNDDVHLTKEDFENGVIIGSPEKLQRLEVDSYIPFYFQDLRKPEEYLFFRAFIDSFTESWAPSWNFEAFYGRTEQVPIYQNTTRTFALGFKVVAMSKSGFSSMWKKISRLQKMMLPSYRAGIMTNSPVIKLRLGDVLASGDGTGIPGVITSFEIDYSQSKWEISEFQINGVEQIGKAPQWMTINLGFQCVHAENPGIDSSDFSFNSKNMRRIGDLEEVPVAQDGSQGLTADEQLQRSLANLDRVRNS